MDESNQETLTPEQLLLRARSVDTEREDLLRQQAALGEHHASCLQERDEILAEMTRLGTSPQSIRADLASLRAELEKKTREYESLVKFSGEKLSAARKALAELQVTSKKKG